MGDELLDATAAARALGLSPTLVRRWIRAGELPALGDRRRYVSLAAVQERARQGTTRPAPRPRPVPARRPVAPRISPPRDETDAWIQRRLGVAG
ncbi:MAG TPA: helix-turn-helix domain-containing protein [Dehalococcoidia bacterium]|nr:helix-turn-helix domain-containing protein [Dehalococcoidia bacterium]